MRADEIQVGRTYTKNGHRGRRLVLAVFKDLDKDFVLCRHPITDTWTAKVDELEDFAKWAQSVLPEPSEAA